jgi:hypothetical protein
MAEGWDSDPLLTLGPRPHGKWTVHILANSMKQAYVHAMSL